MQSNNNRSQLNQMDHIVRMLSPNRSTNNANIHNSQQRQQIAAKQRENVNVNQLLTQIYDMLKSYNEKR